MRILVSVVAALALAMPATAMAQYNVYGNVTEGGSGVTNATVYLYRDGSGPVSSTTTNCGGVCYPGSYIFVRAAASHYYRTYAAYTVGCFVHSGWSPTKFMDAFGDDLELDISLTATRYC